MNSENGVDKEVFFPIFAIAFHAKSNEAENKHNNRELRQKASTVINCRTRF